MMKLAGKTAVCLAGGLALNAGLRAETVVLPGNPYAPIVARNVFDLNPPPKIDASTVDANPPPKITPNGIMDVFGHLQVLFKAAGDARPGQPSKDNSYILGEGQRQDDIEVMKINEKAGTVTFNNHGTLQELPLASAPASAAPAPGMMSPNIPGARPNFNGGGNPFGGPGNFGGNGGNFGGRNPGGGNGGNNFNGQPFGSVPSGNNYSPQAQQQPTMTPEEQVIAIEANRELTKQQVMDGTMPPLPPTLMTPADATGVGGAPLVNEESQTK
jgi:hypothetical protein